MCLAEVVLLNFSKLPFTCSYSPKGTFKTRWHLYLLALWLYSAAFAAIERRAWESEQGMVALLMALLGAAGALSAYGRLRRGRAIVLFDDPPDDPTQRLGLMSRE